MCIFEYCIKQMKDEQQLQLNQYWELIQRRLVMLSIQTNGKYTLKINF